MATSFADSIKANCQKILTNVDKQCTTIASDLFTSIVNLSPSPTNPGEHAKGLLANQWYPLIGSSFSDEIDSSTSPYGADSLARIDDIVTQKVFYSKDNSVTLSNNVPYGEMAEKLGWMPIGGHTPPYRMIELSMIKTVAEINK